MIALRSPACESHWADTGQGLQHADSWEALHDSGTRRTAPAVANMFTTAIDERDTADKLADPIDVGVRA